jgi:hypothetical protein
VEGADVMDVGGWLNEEAVEEEVEEVGASERA